MNSINTFLSIAATLNSSTSTLDSNLAILPLPKFSDYLNKSVSGSIFMRNCKIPEIKKIISELSSSKASDIPIRVLKACFDIISPLLTKFYNIFMQKAIFPNMLKVAQVTPIYKKEIHSSSKITNLFQCYQYLVNSLKK